MMTRYVDVKTNSIFFFEDNWDYPKKKSPFGHIDLRDGVTGYMPDDIPVITVDELRNHAALKQAYEAALEYIAVNVCDPDTTKIMAEAWDKLLNAQAALLAAGNAPETEPK